LVNAGVATGLADKRAHGSSPVHCTRSGTREVGVDPEEIETLAGAAEGIDTSDIDLREAKESQVERLRQHMDAGGITEADSLLLVGNARLRPVCCRLCSRGGHDYQAIKKRRQRAEAAIRRFEGKKG